MNHCPESLLSRLRGEVLAHSWRCCLTVKTQQKFHFFSINVIQIKFLRALTSSALKVQFLFLMEFYLHKYVEYIIKKAICQKFIFLNWCVWPNETKSDLKI